MLVGRLLRVLRTSFLTVRLASLLALVILYEVTETRDFLDGRNRGARASGACRCRTSFSGYSWYYRCILVVVVVLFFPC